VICRFYCPEDNIEERSKTDGVPYQQWVEEGFISTTPGNTIDQAWILEDLKNDMEQFEIQEVPFDRWGSPRACSRSWMTWGSQSRRSGKDTPR